MIFNGIGSFGHTLLLLMKFQDMIIESLRVLSCVGFDLFYLAAKKATCLKRSSQGTNGFKSPLKGNYLRIECLAYGHKLLLPVDLNQ